MLDMKKIDRIRREINATNTPKDCLRRNLRWCINELISLEIDRIKTENRNIELSYKYSQLRGMMDISDAC